MGKFMIGVATAALWFALSHVANAESVCRQVCDDGTCVSKCVQHPDSEVIVREHEHWRDRPAADVDAQVPGVGFEISR